MGLLDQLSALKYQPTGMGNGLINMGAAMMGQAPSRLPQSAMQGIGQGLMAFNQGYGDQQQLETEQAAAQQKSLLDAAAIRKDDAQAGYYANGGVQNDGYHQPIQTSQGWAQWNKELGDYQLIKLDGTTALPVSADVPLAGNMAGAKADAGNTMQQYPDGREVLTRNATITGPYNNPGNLRPQGQSTGFQQFDTPEQGLTAIDKNLQAYGTKHSIDTLSGVINRWAPPSENNTQAYIDDVSKRLGLKPDQKIDLNNPVIRQALSTAITLHESGPSNVFGQSTLSKARDASKVAIQEAEAKSDIEINKKEQEATRGRQRDARDAIGILNQAAPLLPASTGSGVGALLDTAAGFFGQSTSGAEAAQSLKVLGGALVAKMPKMSGPQSDKDALLYRQMAAEIGDPWIPKERKAAAVKELRKLQERYINDGGPAQQPTAEDGSNDPAYQAYLRSQQ